MGILTRVVVLTFAVGICLTGFAQAAADITTAAKATAMADSIKNINSVWPNIGFPESTLLADTKCVITTGEVAACVTKIETALTACVAGSTFTAANADGDTATQISAIGTKITETVGADTATTQEEIKTAAPYIVVILAEAVEYIVTKAKDEPAVFYLQAQGDAVKTNTYITAPLILYAKAPTDTTKQGRWNSMKAATLSTLLNSFILLPTQQATNFGNTANLATTTAADLAVLDQMPKDYLPLTLRYSVITDATQKATIATAVAEYVTKFINAATYETNMSKLKAAFPAFYPSWVLVAKSGTAADVVADLKKQSADVWKFVTRKSGKVVGLAGEGYNPARRLLRDDATEGRRLAEGDINDMKKQEKTMFDNLAKMSNSERKAFADQSDPDKKALFPQAWTDEQILAYVNTAGAAMDPIQKAADAYSGGGGGNNSAGGSVPVMLLTAVTVAVGVFYL